MTTRTKPAATIPLPRMHSTYDSATVMGVMAGENGQPDYLLLDLGVEPENDVTWKQAIDWAKSVGGELPTRREQSMLFANRREGQYRPRWYWSCEQHAGEPDWAWFQLFDGGNQNCTRKVFHLRARAVRRVPFQ